MYAIPTEIHWIAENGTWKVLEISRPHIQNFKTTVPIFKTTKCGQDHTKIGTALTHESRRNTSFTNVNQAAVPMIGPLHIALNAKEDIMQNFHGFFKFMYEHIFPKSKLADKPRPWRTAFLLEVTYGGWTLIRSKVKQIFRKCRHPLYGIFLNLLDSYLPLVLSMYSVSFRLNNFEQYYETMILVWIMFYCFRRHHYDKAPLVWISDIMYWREKNPSLLETVKKYLVITDEYPVENTHSIIRAQTNDGDSPSMLNKKAKAVFQSKQEQHLFRTSFTPPKHFSFHHDQLEYLKVQSSEILSEMFARIADLLPGTELGESDLDKMLGIFNPPSSKLKVLPLAYQTAHPPDPNKCCDIPGCSITDDKVEWNVVEGCHHSFHADCIKEVTFCPICRFHLSHVLSQLGRKAMDAILAPDSSSDDEDDDDETSKEAGCKEVPYASGDFLSTKIKTITVKIESLNPFIPSSIVNDSSPIIPVEKGKKPPHCRKCGHAKKGHKVRKGQDETCNLCPGKVCNEAHKKLKCTCNWHSDGSKVPTTVPTPFTRLDAGGITELSFPKEFCQSGLQYGQGSNSCTAIATLVCKYTIEGRFLTEQHLKNFDDLSIAYRKIMQEGNVLYGSIQPIDGQPNLSVEEVLQYSNKDLFLHMPQSYVGIFDVKALEEELLILKTNRESFACVLNLPPDKSIAICYSEERIIFLDSHQHGNRGAVVAFAAEKNIKELCIYLDGFFKRNYHMGIYMSNLKLLEKYSHEQ